VIFKRVQHVSIPIPMGGADQARAFYTGVLGIPEKRVPKELDATRLTWFAVGEDEHEIHCFVDDDYEDRSTAQHFCLEVDDINGLRKQVDDAGVQIDETIAIHNRPRFFVRDPFGNQIELTQIDGMFEED
jgi:catechol 2,3-dioxygenase-like lactoylglutathione lyase family enzyme